LQKSDGPSPGLFQCGHHCVGKEITGALHLLILTVAQPDRGEIYDGLAGRGGRQRSGKSGSDGGKEISSLHTE
jgi:hypothetical protein